MIQFTPTRRACNRKLGKMKKFSIWKIHHAVYSWTTIRYKIHVLLICFNPLAPGRFKVNFRWVIFKLILVVNGWGISCETALIWMSLDHIYGKSILVQVMAWCRQATSHYLSQCWPRSMSPNGITRPQWILKIYQPASYYSKTLIHHKALSMHVFLTHSIDVCR